MGRTGQRRGHEECLHSGHVSVSTDHVGVTGNGVRHEQVPGRGNGGVREHSTAPESPRPSLAWRSPCVFCVPLPWMSEEHLGRLILLFNLAVSGPKALVLSPEHPFLLGQCFLLLGPGPLSPIPSASALPPICSAFPLSWALTPCSWRRTCCSHGDGSCQRDLPWDESGRQRGLHRSCRGGPDPTWSTRALIPTPPKPPPILVSDGVPHGTVRRLTSRGFPRDAK